MTLTSRRLNRATLARQLLLRREPLDVADAVRRVVALQAQHAASPYIGLWNRIAGFEPRDLDAAFATRAVIKATLLRITLHAVHADDYATFHAAMLSTLRASRLHDRRFKSTGLSIADADALIPELAEFAAAPRTNAQAEDWLRARVGDGARWMWWALRTFAPLLHAPTGAPWSFGERPAYVAAPGLPPAAGRHECVQRLVRRYLEGFGPATVQDVAQFALVPRADIRDAVRSLGDALVDVKGADGSELFDVPEAPLPDEETPAPPRLLPMWDSILLAYFDRSRIIPPDYRRLVARQNGDMLPTLLVDGHVAGVWRPADGGIEATAFHRLSDETWSQLGVEARSLVLFLRDREPGVYRRYANWWKTLAAAEVRFLPG